MDNYFQLLNSINVNDKTEKKNGLTYLSWAWAWGEVKKIFPDATYTVYENKDGWLYHTDGRTCWVKTGVTVNGIEHIEYLPVMDFRNSSIPLEKVTSYDVNKSIQRSLTKAVARHGLGLYIYAGEDLPEEETKKDEPKENAPAESIPAKTAKEEPKTEKIMQDPKAKEEPKRPGLINALTKKEITLMANKASMPMEEILKQAGVKTLDDMTQRTAEAVRKALGLRIKRLAEEAKNGSDGKAAV